jgi:methylenetetrahydrofolate reductase (NADPH)
VVQPYVVDPAAFPAWRDEAFDLWTSEWAALYEAESVATTTLKSIADSYVLVSVTDNDYISGDLLAAMGVATL